MKYELSLAALCYLSEQSKPILRANIIGLDDQRGGLEAYLDKDFTKEERSLLDMILRNLQKRGLIQPAFKEIIARGDDLEITDKGRAAITTKSLDKLDEALKGLDSEYNLVEIRYGAHDAALNKQRDWQRHVATSLVELVDKTLQTIAPKDKLKDQLSKTNQKGERRRLKIKYYVSQKHGNGSKSTEKVVEKAFGLVEACRDKLEGIKHHKPRSDKEAEHLIGLTEDALSYLLN